MLSSLFVRLRSVFLCCTFTYYLPAKCTFHSQDPLSTLPPLFSLSSFSPVSSRFTETSVPPANKINASVSCIFAFDENVETLTRPVGSSGSVNFSILPSLSLMRSSTEANGSAWKDFQNNGARVAWHHSQHHLWSSFWQDKAFCICTHTFHEFHRNHRTERFFVQNSSKVDRPWLQKVIRQFPLQVFSVVAHLSENSFGHSTILSALSSFQPEEHRRSLPPRIHSFSLSLSRSLIPCVSWPLARSSSPLSLSDIFVTEASPLALFRAK